MTGELVGDDVPLVLMTMLDRRRTQPVLVWPATLSMTHAHWTSDRVAQDEPDLERALWQLVDLVPTG